MWNAEKAIRAFRSGEKPALYREIVWHWCAKKTANGCM